MKNSDLMSREIIQVVVSLAKQWQLKHEAQVQLAGILLSSEYLQLRFFHCDDWTDRLEALFLKNYEGGVESFEFSLFVADLKNSLADKVTLAFSKIFCRSLYCEKFSLMIPFAQSIQNRQQHLPELYVATLGFAEMHCIDPDLAKMMAYALVCFARCSNRDFDIKQQFSLIYQQFYLGQKLANNEKKQCNKNFAFFCNDLLGQLSLDHGRYGFLPQSSGVPSYRRMTLAAINKKRTLREGAMFCDRAARQGASTRYTVSPNEGAVKCSTFKTSQ